MVTCVLSELRAAAGKIGGLSTAKNHDHEFYVNIGTKGVRARGIEPVADMLTRIEIENREKEGATVKKFSKGNIRPYSYNS